MPSASDEVVSVAAPAASVTVPSVVAPSIKVTVPPVGVPPPLVTVAVNVTGLPTSLGFCDDASVVVVVDRLMIWVRMLDVDPALLLSPPYTAVMECGPGDNADVVKVAIADTVVAEPSNVALSKNCTVPVGLIPVTVAVKVTDCPNGLGLALEPSVVPDVA